MTEIPRPNQRQVEAPSQRRVERGEFEATRERLVRTLGEVVRFQSIADGQHNQEIRGLFDYVQGRVTEASEQSNRQFLTQEWDDGQGHISTIITPFDPDRPKEKAILQPKIAMLIHADVVNAENPEMFTVHQEGDDLVGRGTLDMKGGLVIGLDLLPDLPVGAALIITSDEEVGGEHGAQFLAQEVGVRPDFLIVLDGQKPEHISYGAKGAWHARVEFGSLLQKGGHGSRYEDYSANELAMDVRNVLRTHYPWRYSNSPAGTTFNIGVMNGGVATNKVAQQGFLQIDMRFSSEEDRGVAKERTFGAIQHAALERFHEVYGDTLPVTVESSVQQRNGHEVWESEVVRLDNGERYPLASVETIIEIPVYAIDPNTPTVRRFGQLLEEVTGEPVKVNDKDTGAHDGSNWPNVPAIVYLPKGSGAHTSSEQVSATSLVQTREAIQRLLQEKLG